MNAHFRNHESDIKRIHAPFIYRILILISACSDTETPRHRDAAIRGQDLGEIDQPPADHPVGGRHRLLIDQPAQRLPLPGVQARASPGRPAADQPVRTVRVERHDPVPHSLMPDPAESGGGRA